MRLMTKAVEQFHPAVQAWLAQAFEQITPVQEQAWAAIAGQEHCLIAAPTGSGKTLAAFMSAINHLVVNSLAAPLPDAVQVLYVSPLKALSNDIQKNLQAPLLGITEQLQAAGLSDPLIRDGVRTGDTPQAERTRQRKNPPHILVTTPESLYILLTSESGRAMLGDVKTVIIDELHAVAGGKRGAHLMLSLERLAALNDEGFVRIGLSATQKPIERMAQYLVGGQGGCRIVDTGHKRRRDLALELPLSPLETVLSGEVWEEIYDRLSNAIVSHQTTLIFVNQRRIAERVAKALGERLGKANIAAHHGSLSKEHRLDAEQRLKAGQLQALVATASLELGIDIGDIDLVCQLGSPGSIAAFLQRVGRSGHAVHAVPKGRLYPLSEDELVECVALIDACERGELDKIVFHPAPKDVLAQQIVAEVAAQEWGEQALYERFCRAEPYHELSQASYQAVLSMLADGYSTRRGRRGAYLHWDRINGRLRARKSARLTALTNGGTIPDQFDYDVMLMPEGQKIGTLNEDFSFESLPGDIFQLGNRSYRIQRVETGKVIVEDADGLPPTVPFWFGERPGRTNELSQAVSRLREQANALLPEASATEAVEESVPKPAAQQHGKQQSVEKPTEQSAEQIKEQIAEQESLAEKSAAISQALQPLQNWLATEMQLAPVAASQLTNYLAAGKFALSALPTQNTVVFERFFDETGDTHLVIHAPFGSRIMRAWGLALRKRFCRKFNFELQAAALEDALVLSLGPTHSFPLLEIKDYLKSATVREVLIQALLDAPMFASRWRWNLTTALAVKRMFGGKKSPPQFQRSDAEDALAVVFPDQLACQENLSGNREVPDHPLVEQAIADCLHDTMDIDGLEAVLKRIEQGEITVIARELAGPSALAGAVLTARPYAFLDDGEAEERRTRNIRMQGVTEPETAADLGKLDPQAIARVLDEVRPEPANPDELHDALVVYGFLPADASLQGQQAAGERVADLMASAPAYQQLLSDGRVLIIAPPGGQRLYIAAERAAEFAAVFPDLEIPCQIQAQTIAAELSADSALVEIIRSRLELLGPVTAAELAQPLGLGEQALQFALLSLEQEGFVMRGSFTAPTAAEEWCERRILVRINRYTVQRRRAGTRPVSPAAYMRFLLAWQQLGEERRAGDKALPAVLAQLEGWASSAAAWEQELLPSRVEDYQGDMLDQLCRSGRISWSRAAAKPQARPRAQPQTKPALKPTAEHVSANREPVRQKSSSGPVKSTPIVLLPRQHMPYWQAVAQHTAAQIGQQLATAEDSAPTYSSRAENVLRSLQQYGASFFDELRQDTRLLATELEQALGELVSHGVVTSDAFAGLRALVANSDQRKRAKRYGNDVLANAGRWALQRRASSLADEDANLGAASLGREPHIEHIARVLLRRYGVVFKRVLQRESNLPSWRELYYVYRRLEARGEVQGGRFVNGFSGEQFALPEAAAMLNKHREEPATAEAPLVVVSATDPLNLAGIILPGERIAAVFGNRLLLRAGHLVAEHSGGKVTHRTEVDQATAWAWDNLLIRAQRPAAFGSAGRRMH